MDAGEATMVDQGFPLEIESITSLWLESVLRSESVAKVRSSKVEHVIWGTATKALISVEVEDHAGQSRRLDLCVKGPFDEALRQYYDLGVMFVVEAAFYRDIAPLLTVPLPHSYYATEDGQYGIVILENMTARGCTFADPQFAMTPDQAAAGLRTLAGIHGSSWGWKTDRFDWLQLGSASTRAGIPAMSEGDRYSELCARPEVKSFLPAAYADKDRILSALDTLWRRDDSRDDLALVHGDAHLGQVYFDPDGEIGFLDWQSTGLMPPIKDVAYFLGGALSVSDRRAHERDLLTAYLTALHASGGPKLSLDDIWDDYRMQMLQGIVWVVVTEKMQSREAIAALNERYLTAMADLGTLEALGC